MSVIALLPTIQLGQDDARMDPILYESDVQNAIPYSPSKNQFLQSTIKKAILGHSYGSSLFRVQVGVTETTVCLGGNVKSFFLKQIAQEIARQHLPKAYVVKNEIDVTSSQT